MIKRNGCQERNKEEEPAKLGVHVSWGQIQVFDIRYRAFGGL